MHGTSLRYTKPLPETLLMRKNKRWYPIDILANNSICRRNKVILSTSYMANFPWGTRTQKDVPLDVRRFINTEYDIL